MTGDEEEKGLGLELEQEGKEGERSALVTACTSAINTLHKF